MREAFERTVALIGDAAFERLQNAKVLVVGLGGVGGATAEVLARSGVGTLTLVDGDCFEPSNLNRQLLCTSRDIGTPKATAAKNRILSVIPTADVTAVTEYVCAGNVSELTDGHDYCADAIDDIPNKLLLVAECIRKGVPVVSALGAGNRLGCDFRVTDIYNTSNDPFARRLRHELKRLGIPSLDTVCAVTPPTVKHGVPSSIAAPPIVMGAMLAEHIIQRLIENTTAN